MFTQCPNCNTVFRVTVESLRAASGDVRCGVCAASFNALDFLSEQAFEAEAEGAAAEPAFKVVELDEMESIELSTSTDLPPLSDFPDESDGDDEPEPEETADEVEDEDVIEFDSMDLPSPDEDEFQQSVPEISLEAEYALDLEPVSDEYLDLEAALRSSSRISSPAEPEIRLAWDRDRDDLAEDSSLDDGDNTDEFPILVLDEQDEQMLGATLEEEDNDSAIAAFSQPRILIPEDMRRGLLGEAPTAAAEPAEAFTEAPPKPAARRWPWIAALVVLALGLGAQIVHREREALMQDPVVGPWLSQAYSLLGQEQAAPTDLAAFELRQWGASSAPEQAGRLRLRASIVNRAAFAQPFPLLRVALQDRFGTTIGAREVSPEDYLPGERAARLLAPGQRVDAEISIVDPGTEAVGFEIDVCLADGDVIRCASDPDRGP